ncbi:MAG TPA: hypothetical protein VF657_08350 [Actinoplanes sp.]|jgi:hypothetical protein
MPTRSVFAIDLIERALATYVQAFLGLVIAAGADVPFEFSISSARAAALAALPAALAVLKAGIAKMVHDPDSASLAPIAAVPDD